MERHSPESSDSKHKHERKQVVMACKARTHLCGNARCVFEHALNWVVVGRHDRNFALWIRSAQCAAFCCCHARVVDLVWQQWRRRRWLVSCVWWCGRWLAGSEGQTLESECVCETYSCLCLRVCERLFMLVLANSCACSCLHVRVRVWVCALLTLPLGMSPPLQSVESAVGQGASLAATTKRQAAATTATATHASQRPIAATSLRVMWRARGCV
jgi:hypothetical protein